MCSSCGGTCETPLHPKRRLVMRRNWTKEPQEHAMTSGEYRGTMSADQFGQLQATERFNRTPLEM